MNLPDGNKRASGSSNDANRLLSILELKAQEIRQRTAELDSKIQRALRVCKALHCNQNGSQNHQ
jgi:hypothetical protein